MADKQKISYLHLVKRTAPEMPGDITVNSERSNPSRESLEIQPSLFPVMQSNVLIFINISGHSSRDFVQLLENAKPAWLIDIRPMPRFDLGQFNRKMAFELFARNHINYLDLVALKGITSRRDENFSPSQLIDFIRSLLIVEKKKLEGPIAFIFDDKELMSTAIGIFSNGIRGEQRKEWEVCVSG
jgi:hypothetical protein